jgi:hypothetical protein
MRDAREAGFCAVNVQIAAHPVPCRRCGLMEKRRSNRTIA